MDAWKTAKREYHNHRRNLPLRKAELEARDYEVVSALDRVGIYIVKGFWSREKCEQAKGVINEVIDTRLDELWVDEEKSDHRIFGAERAGGVIREFNDDPFINRVLGLYERGVDLSGFTLGARLDFKGGNKGSGGGWHRDQVYRKQSKAMVYLSDVSEQNGPFQYLKGSHTPASIVSGVIRKKFGGEQNRFTDEEANAVIETNPDNLETCVAEAGDLVVFDSRGLHRGMPIQDGTRYALTHYFFSEKGGVPAHIQKLFINE